MSKVIEMSTKFTVYETVFGSYITDRKGKPIKVFFKDGQELDLTNLDVVIYDNGIEII